MADYSETAAAAARRQNGGATSHLGDNANMQEQIDKLQEQIKTMSDSMSKLTENKMNQAKATARDLVKTGQQMADDLSSQAKFRPQGATIRRGCKGCKIDAVAQHRHFLRLRPQPDQPFRETRAYGDQRIRLAQCRANQPPRHREARQLAGVGTARGDHHW